MPTVAERMATTLADAGVERIYGVPGGEILDFIDAARRAGIEFVLTRDETTAAFIADAEGFLTGRPAVCVSTLGPGAINMTLGVANAWLDRSPVIADHRVDGDGERAVRDAPADRPERGLPAVHQGGHHAGRPRHDGRDARGLPAGRGAETRARARCAAERRGQARRPDRRSRVLVALPAARRARRIRGRSATPSGRSAPRGVPVLLLGLDLDPRVHRDAVRRLVDCLDVPVFVTPKVKGLLPEDHPRFLGVCGGVAGDGAILDFFDRADILVGVGYDPVESDKLWHRTNPIVSLGPNVDRRGGLPAGGRRDGRSAPDDRRR